MTVATRRFTAADLAQLHGEDSRYEVIHGELLEKAMPRVEHSVLETKLATVLGRRFDRGKPSARWPGGWHVLVELHVGYEDHEVFCHDLCGYRRERGPVPTQWPVPMRPDWVCELLSPGHEKRDRIDKWSILSRAKVPHYWIINPEEQFLEVYRWTTDGYALALKAAGDAVVRAEPFDAVEIRTNVLLGNEDDED